MNFNALVAAIQLELNDYNSRSKTRIEKWVNEGHRFICQKRRWSFLSVRQSDSITIAPAGFPFDITSGILVGAVVTPAQQIIAVYDVTDGTYEDLQQITYEQLRDLYQTDIGQAGSPEYWYFSADNKLKLYPTLTANVILQFSFNKKLITYPAGSTLALYIPDDYMDVLQEYVLAKAYRYKADDRAESCQESYNRLFQAMTASEANKAGIIYDDPGESVPVFPAIVEIP